MMMDALVLKLYALLMWLLQPLLRRKLARRGRAEPGYLEAVDERFGVYTQPAEAASELLWIHAVSLGETRTAAILLKQLRQQLPGVRILLTHGTATGRAEGAALLQAGDVQVWHPWDSQAAVARFLTHFKPRLGVLMETEVWPNAVAGARARGVPLVLVNARLSDKSLRQARRLWPLSQPAFRALAAVYAQTDSDARRLRQLGAPVAAVLGNLKFDAAPNASQQAQGKAWRQAAAQPVMMFASSRGGEEDEFLKQIVALAQVERAPTAINYVAEDRPPTAAAARFKALIVPRHPQRFNDVQALVEQHGLRVSRRSGWASSGLGPADSEEAMHADVWLGDSLGEMALYYSLSDVALLGGSFAPLGGQNLIEAAACGCPVVMGPHTFNFAEASEHAEAAGAARRVADLSEALQSAQALLASPQAQQAAAAASLNFAASHCGAAASTVAALVKLWKSPAPAA